jgi:hypothetical protein
MTKLIATLIAAMFAAGAVYAQDKKADAPKDAKKVEAKKDEKKAEAKK